MQVCWVILCISHQIDLLVIWRIDCYALRNKGNVLPSHCTMPAAPVLCTSEGTRVLSYKTRNSSTAVSLKGVLLFLLCHCPFHCMKARKCHCHFKPWWWPLNPSSQRLGVCRRNSTLRGSLHLVSFLLKRGSLLSGFPTLVARLHRRLPGLPLLLHPPVLPGG